MVPPSQRGRPPFSGRQTLSCQREAVPSQGLHTGEILVSKAASERVTWTPGSDQVSLALGLVACLPHPHLLALAAFLLPHPSRLLCRLSPGAVQPAHPLRSCPERQVAGMPSGHVTAGHSPLINVVSLAVRKDLTFILTCEKRTSIRSFHSFHQRPALCQALDWCRSEKQLRVR